MPLRKRQFVPGAGILAALAMLSISTATHAAGQALYVVAVDSNANRPLRDAMVVLLDREADVLGIRRTDRRGAVRFEAIEPGHYALRVSARGYAERITSWIVVSAADTLQATVRLARAAQLLDPVIVSSNSDSAAQYLPVGVTPTMGATVMPPGLLERHVAGAGDYVNLITQLGVKGLTVRYWRRNESQHEIHSCIRSTRVQQSCILLFVNDARVDDFEAAKYLIVPEQIGWAVLVPPIHAGVLYGNGADQGALLIYTRDRLSRLR